jgi:TolB-like protein
MSTGMMWSAEAEGRHTEKEPMMKWMLVGIGSLILPVLITSCRGEAEPPAEALIDERPGIAVLPFDNLSTDPEDAYLSAGMHEEVLAGLARIPDLRVIGRSSVMDYADVTKPVSEIVSELGVEYLLEGATRISGDRLRITVQLVDGRTVEHVWAESFDRELSVENLFAIQQEIAATVVETVAALLESPPTDSVH